MSILTPQFLWGSSASSPAFVGCFHKGTLDPESPLARPSIAIENSPAGVIEKEVFAYRVAGNHILLFSMRQGRRVLLHKSSWLSGKLVAGEVSRSVCFTLKEEPTNAFCPAGGVNIDTIESRRVIPVGSTAPVEDKKQINSFPCFSVIDEAQEN